MENHEEKLRFKLIVEKAIIAQSTILIKKKVIFEEIIIRYKEYDEFEIADQGGFEDFSLMILVLLVILVNFFLFIFLASFFISVLTFESIETTVFTILRLLLPLLIVTFVCNLFDSIPIYFRFIH